MPSLTLRRGVSINRPSILMSRTRDTSSRSLHCQQSQISSEVARRVKARREYDGFCCTKLDSPRASASCWEGDWGPTQQRCSSAPDLHACKNSAIPSAATCPTHSERREKCISCSVPKRETVSLC